MKYKLWWLVCCAISCLFAAEFVFYGITGMMLFDPAHGPAMVRLTCFCVAAFAVAFGMIEKVHTK